LRSNPIVIGGTIEFELEQGAHTLWIGHGEIGARLDALYLTNNPNPDPEKLVDLTSHSVAPAVNLGPDRLVSDGNTLSIQGTFADPDPDEWTGVVDYGDGLGIQSLPLNGREFILSYLYAQDGTYTVTITISDNKGASGSDTLEIWVVSSGPFFKSRDLDSDGLIEDINGNGRFEFADLVDLYTLIDSPEVQDHKSRFDFNQDGVADFSDIELMFSRLATST